MVVNAIALNDTTLICDDLLDEWADFIGIRSENGLTQITFYHAKHDSVGLGAGQFHISVSQAMKNLGNMLFPADRMGAKIDGWTKTYNNQGARTGINRIIRQPFAGIDVAISHLRSAPDLVRRATIVTSSLRKQDIQQSDEVDSQTSGEE